MSRVLLKNNPYDSSIAQKFPIHDHPLYSTRDHGPCAGCFEGKERSSEFLECPECDIFLHKECIKSAPEITHPFHPQHSLRLVKRESLQDASLCKCCSLCGEKLMLLLYSCFTCDFKLDLSCAKNPPLLEINQSKVDQHKLYLLMKKVIFTCDACGFQGDRSPYLCITCNLMFHVRCVYFPHDHRYSSALTARTWKCECKHTHSDAVPYENIMNARALEDVKVEEVSEQDIREFTHEHNLIFHEDGEVKDVSTSCDACKLPVVGTPYSCCSLGCEFFLHKRCTKLLREKRSMLHYHPLKLEDGVESTEELDKFFCCNACGHLHNGVRYSCHPGFNLDVGCALVSVPFKSAIHQHPLTFVSTEKQECGVCKLWASPVLSCATCDFRLGFDCAQLPVTARHKYDKHVLYLDNTRDEKRVGTYWCEICEKKVDLTEIFYTCDENSCCATFHTHCVTGGLNLKLNFRFTLFSHEFVVKPNTLNARRYCCICGLECKGPRVIKRKNSGDTRNRKYLCSSSCLMRNRRLLENL